MLNQLKSQANFFRVKHIHFLNDLRLNKNISKINSIFNFHSEKVWTDFWIEIES